MRRILLFAAFLLLLGLSTAMAASFDVQAEDITSFTTDVSISVPTTTMPPPPASETYYLTGGPGAGRLVTIEPTTQSPVENGKFQPNAQAIGIEARQPEPGSKVWYMAWRTLTPSPGVPPGASFTNQKIRLYVDTGNNFSGTMTAALFDCPAGTPEPTLIANGCRQLVAWTGTASPFTSAAFTDSVAQGRELHLKMVNLGAAEWTIQWGYKPQNRPARFDVLAASAP